MRSRLILASSSRARRELLSRAGVDVEIVPPRVDEDAAKAALRAEGAPARDVADALAELKAMRVSAKMPGAFVLGADQVLSLDGRMFDKPRDLAEARAHLELLRGRRHQLLSAAVLCHDGRAIWRHVGVVRLVMRPFTDAFLEEYLSREGADLLETVGGYKLEQGGAQLFERIDGDYFTVLGLPLLELLAQLRRLGICPT